MLGEDVPLCYFVSFISFSLVLDVGPLARFRPRPRNLLIKFCVYFVTGLETISPAFTSGDMFSAISDKILPPVFKVCRPRALSPLQRTSLTQRNKLPKKFLIPCPR